MTVDFVFGSLNVHRLDCDRDHYHPCRSWDQRGPELAGWIKDTMRASVYAFQECMPQQAADITAAIGWGDASNPPYVCDENQNAVAYDRTKWTDIGVYQLSLSKDSGDLGDSHRRSVVWVLLEHLESGRRVWVGSAHLENGNAEEREREAARLVDVLPPEYPFVLGIDRNSYTTSEGGPRDIFDQAGMIELDPDNPDDQRSFNQWDHTQEPKDGKSIDGQHYSEGVIIRDGAMEYTTALDLTDHNALVGKLTI